MVTGGGSLYEAVHSASIKELTARFFKKAKWPTGLPPLFAAWSILPTGAPDTIPDKQDRLVYGSEKARPTSEETAQAESGKLIRTETVLVTVPVIISDANGRYVTDLTKSEFRHFEDGIEQKIDRLIDEPAPFQTALMMDTSRSTGFVRSEIQSAALAFLDSLHHGDELMALSLSNLIHIDSEFTPDLQRVRKAITDQKKMCASMPCTVPMPLFSSPMGRVRTEVLRPNHSCHRAHSESV